MHTTTPATTVPPTPPPRPVVRWSIPENVRRLLDKIADRSDGHMTLSVYDPTGAESVTARAEVADVGDPDTWVMRSIAATLRARPSACTHMRLRLWAPGGTAEGGAKFRAPEPAALGAEAAPSGKAPVPAVVDSRSVGRTDMASSVVVRRVASVAPTSTPGRTEEDVRDAVRRETARIRDELDAVRRRALRAEESEALLQRKLRARSARIAELESRCAGLAAERDAHEAQVAELVEAVQELADAMEEE